jgi:hypothetical protein
LASESAQAALVLVSKNPVRKEGASMKKQFTVASREPQKVEREVLIDGAKVPVLVPAVIAQLIPDKDDGTGTIKVALSAEDLGLFRPGDKIVVEFSAAE